MSGRIYYDGTCFRHAEPELSTATFAVIELDELGAERAVLQGTVSPDLPQTSQAAEHCGRAAAVQTLCGPAVLHGDCRNVVEDATKTDKVIANKKRMHAGASRYTRSLATGRFVKADQWATGYGP